jgi:alpha-amylase
MMAALSSALGLALIFISVLIATTQAATASDWRSRSIYQIVTDRFSPPASAGAPSCSVADRKYCGGTWQGIIDRLDYIKGMGFDAVWISPVVDNIPENTPYGEAYHGRPILESKTTLSLTKADSLRFRRLLGPR